MLGLVADNLTYLSMRHSPVSHPLFSAYRLSSVAELRAYKSTYPPSRRRSLHHFFAKSPAVKAFHPAKLASGFERGMAVIK